MIEREWLAVPVSFALTWAVVRLRLRFADRGLDEPNHRSLHEKPTPYGGGLGIVLALLAVGAWLGVPTLLLAAVLGLALLSFADDLWHLPFWLRLAAHLGAAAALCHQIGLPVLWWLPAMLAVGWMTNLYNFMDGADGLAGSQGVADSQPMRRGSPLPATRSWLRGARRLRRRASAFCASIGRRRRSSWEMWVPSPWAFSLGGSVSSGYGKASGPRGFR